LSIKNYDNEKIFKIIGCPYLYIMAILAFSYFTSKPLPEGKKESKPNLLIKSKRLSIKKHGSTTAVSFTFMETTIIYGIKKTI
jgi:hypothetical protein